MCAPEPCVDIPTEMSTKHHLLKRLLGTLLVRDVLFPSLQEVAVKFMEPGVRALVTSCPEWWLAKDSMLEAGGKSLRASRRRAGDASADTAHPVDTNNAKRKYDGPSPASTIISDGKATTNQTDSTTVTTTKSNANGAKMTAGAAHTAATGAAKGSVGVRGRTRLANYVIQQQQMDQPTSHSRTVEDGKCREYVQRHDIEIWKFEDYVAAYRKRFRGPSEPQAKTEKVLSRFEVVSAQRAYC